MVVKKNFNLLNLKLIRFIKVDGVRNIYKDKSDKNGNFISDSNILNINITNKNDLLEIIGPPSSISDFNKNKWFYFERLKTNQSIIKLGTQKIKKNNVLIVELDENGILKSKQILDLKNMNIHIFKI